MAKSSGGAHAHRPRPAPEQHARKLLWRWPARSSSSPTERSPTGTPPLSLKDRFEALRSLPLLFHLLWVTSPRMTVATVLLRLARAAVPLAVLYLGKLIVNEVVRLKQVDGEPELIHLWTLVAAECG